MPKKESHSVINQGLIVAAISLMLVSSAFAAATDKTLHAFTCGTDGEYPLSGVIIDARGNLYGTTWDGGISNCTEKQGDTSCGTVFKLTPSGTGWAESVLYRFRGGEDGGHPLSTPVLDEAGNLYGTTSEGGGSKNCGATYKLTPSQTGQWTETIVHTFGNGNDACTPVSHLVFDEKGNLWGTTVAGGGGLTQYLGPCQNGCGTVFRLTPQTGGAWVESVIHHFTGKSQTDGQNPNAGVVFDKSGNAWGATTGGGTSSAGTVFELVPVGGGWKETIVHAFAGCQLNCNQGVGPFNSVIFDQAGNVYGTADVVFKLTPKSSGGFAYSVIKTFTLVRDGATPNGLAFDAAGNLYGAAIILGGQASGGTVFKLTPTAKGEWKETVLHTFSGHKDGLWPILESLATDAQGHLYGSTMLAGDAQGTAGDGVVFEVTP